MPTATLSPRALAVRVHISMLLAVARVTAELRRLHDERGQTSAEYALVLLGAATVALLITAWATKTGKLGQLLDKIFDTITGKVK